MGKADTATIDQRIRAKAKVDYYDLVDQKMKELHNILCGFGGSWSQEVETAERALEDALKEHMTPHAQELAVRTFIDKVNNLEEYINEVRS